MTLRQKISKLNNSFSLNIVVSDKILWTIKWKKCYYSEHRVCANSESVKKVNLMSTVVKLVIDWL